MDPHSSHMLAERALFPASILNFRAKGPISQTAQHDDNHVQGTKAAWKRAPWSLAQTLQKVPIQNTTSQTFEVENNASNKVQTRYAHRVVLPSSRWTGFHPGVNRNISVQHGSIMFNLVPAGFLYIILEHIAWTCLNMFEQAPDEVEMQHLKLPEHLTEWTPSNRHDLRGSPWIPSQKENQAKSWQGLLGVVIVSMWNSCQSIWSMLKQQQYLPATHSCVGEKQVPWFWMVVAGNLRSFLPSPLVTRHCLIFLCAPSKSSKSSKSLQVNYQIYKHS